MLRNNYLHPVDIKIKQNKVNIKLLSLSDLVNIIVWNSALFTAWC